MVYPSISFYMVHNKCMIIRDIMLYLIIISTIKTNMHSTVIIIENNIIKIIDNLKHSLIIVNIIIAIIIDDMIITDNIDTTINGDINTPNA
mgnify:CR=1 FL=1